MKRWITSVGLVAIVGCTQAPTSSVEEAVTDCTPGDNYKTATLPKMGYWDGYTPQAAPGQLTLDYADPATKGQHLAFVVDPGKGYVVWAAIVPDKQLYAFRTSVGGSEPQINDCCRPPPPGPGGGTLPGVIASFVLEAGLRYLQVPDQALIASHYSQY
jgi:hypothetical protein